jgi:hypothetical protein
MFVIAFSPTSFAMAGVFVCINRKNNTLLGILGIN